MRVERPPADEILPPPPYLEASVLRPTSGIGPEARLAGLDERTELRIILPRWRANMVEHMHFKPKSFLLIDNGAGLTGITRSR